MRRGVRPGWRIVLLLLAGLVWPWPHSGAARAAASTADAAIAPVPSHKRKEPDKAKDIPQPPKNLEELSRADTISVLGKKVRGPAGEDMGRVVDLLLDRDAKLRAAVIDFGGFLGVGSRKIAIDWRLIRFNPDDHDAPISLTLGKSDVQAAPEYKDATQPSAMVGPPPPDPDASR